MGTCYFFGKNGDMLLFRGKMGTCYFFGGNSGDRLFRPPPSCFSPRLPREKWGHATFSVEIPGTGFSVHPHPAFPHACHGVVEDEAGPPLARRSPGAPGRSRAACRCLFNPQSETCLGVARRAKTGPKSAIVPAPHAVPLNVERWTLAVGRSSLPLSPCSSPPPMPKSTLAATGNVSAWSDPTASACTS